MTKTTNKQKRFADEYLIDCNATRAYKAAYPRVKSDNSAAVCAAKLLRKAKVAEYIENRLDYISSEKIATTTETMEYLTSVLRGESRSDVIVVEGTGDGVSKARIITKGADEKEKLRAAELLGKAHGLFKGGLEVKMLEPITIINDLKG